MISQAELEALVGVIQRMEATSAPDGPSIMQNADIDDDPASRVKR